MRYLIITLFTLVIFMGCTPNHEEAYAYAEMHYNKFKFIDFYEKHLSYVYTIFETTYIGFNVTQIDSMVYAIVTQDMFFGDSIHNFKTILPM